MTDFIFFSETPGERVSPVSQAEMEHDLLQNVTERAWPFVLSQGCSTQFLNEETKLPPPLFPPSLFHSPCAVSPVPLRSLGTSRDHPSVIKDFCLINIVTQIFGHLWAKAKARCKMPSAEHAGCERCRWHDGILLSPVFFFPGWVGRSRRKASRGAERR